MNEFITLVIIGGLIGTVVGVIFVLFQPQKFCPDCGKQLPKFRMPKNLKQLLGARRACAHCGCTIDCKGMKINK